MKESLISRRILLSGLFSLLAFVAMATIQPKPFVVPELKEWHGKEGTLTLTQECYIKASEKQPEATRIAHLFAEDFQQMTGIKLPVETKKSGKGAISFALKADKKLGKEGYEIKLSSNGITVTAPEAVGLYWATRTLLQMAEQNENHQLPLGTIRDYPDYEIRGFMIDCGRKFIPLHYLQDLVKTMAYYKMNTLQIHLNDNGFKQFFDNDWSKTYAAFRLECDTYPELTARDGSYTKKEFIDLQKQAAGQFVEIIPEIDAPAHTLAFSHYKPEIGSEKYGMDHLDLFNPETYSFLDGLFKEYLGGDEPVFCGKRVHIGTDEYSNKDQAVVEKFREFTDRYIRLVESYGKQACIWGALTHAKGTTPVKSENVVMSAWYNGYADPKAMAKEGYRLISIPDGLVYLVPAAGYYYDYLNEKRLYESWTPAHVGKVVFDEKDPAIMGGMFAVWNDHVGNGISTKDIHHRVFPALQTLAVKTWSGNPPTLSYEEFDTHRKALSEAPGVNQLGRIGKKPELVYQTESVKPGSTSPYPEIGYDYTVCFDIEGRKELPGTELFRSRDAVFYLADPISGMFAFARDGYLNTFRFAIREGEKASIRIEGDSKTTVLKVNGKLVDEMNIQKRYFDKEGKAKINYVRTLVFPLEKAGRFNSRISNLKVYNYRLGD